jgi:hypothetical protein
MWVCNPSNVYLIEILIPIAYMPLDKYIQEASFNPYTNRFYVRKGAAGATSVSIKNVKVLAQNIYFTKAETK